MPHKKPTFMIYGANGYTGELTARLAAARGLKPILAGRNAAAVTRLATELDLPYRLFALDSPDIIAEAIADAAVVLHCAGPFWRTSKPMADACIRTRTHYLDITGEIEVFEALAARYDEAYAAGVMLLPGAGFDVVPSDCLAAHLHEPAAHGHPPNTGARNGWRLLTRHAHDRHRADRQRQCRHDPPR